MFGYLRTIWAIMVVVGHIFWVGDFGRFAVFGFYILSGYLMTYVVQNNYGYTRSSKIRFTTNRFLRLFPGYWFACTVTIFILFFLGPFHNEKYSVMLLPDSALSIFANFTMIFPHWLPSQIEPRLSPASWALTVELFFYGAIILGASKTLFRTYLWLGLSVFFVLVTYALGLFWHARYFSIPAGSLPFSLGALIFFMIKENKTRFIPKILTEHPFTLFMLMFLTALFVSITITKGLPLWLMEILFYCSMVFSFFLVLSLAMGKPFISSFPKSLDKKLGDYSYPFYLLHYQATLIASYIIFGQASTFKGNVTLTAVLLIFSILLMLSIFVIYWIERPIDKLRNKIRNTT